MRANPNPSPSHLQEMAVRRLGRRDVARGWQAWLDTSNPDPNPNPSPNPNPHPHPRPSQATELASEHAEFLHATTPHALSSTSRALLSLKAATDGGDAQARPAGGRAHPSVS